MHIDDDFAGSGINNGLNSAFKSRFPGNFNECLRA